MRLPVPKSGVAACKPNVRVALAKQWPDDSVTRSFVLRILRRISQGGAHGADYGLKAPDDGQCAERAKVCAVDATFDE
jgi:hypothetical protein